MKNKATTITGKMNTKTRVFRLRIVMVLYLRYLLKVLVTPRLKQPVAISLFYPFLLFYLKAIYKITLFYLHLMISRSSISLTPAHP